MRVARPSGSPASHEHYANTIEQPVPLERLFRFVESELVDQLRRDYASGTVPVWGVTKGQGDVNLRKWLKIQPGDVAFFATRGGVFSCGEVGIRTQNAELARELWGSDDEGRTWECVYFLKNMQATDIPYSTLNHLLGYKPTALVQGFNVLGEEKSRALLDYVGAGPTPTEDEYSRAALELEKLDDKREQLVRREQTFLRRQVIGRSSSAECVICGREFPVELLVAAHVKPRSKCTDAEKRDFRANVFPMCRMGCDELFERRYISVNQGTVRRIASTRLTPSVEKEIQLLEGRTCGSYGPISKQYFDWHWKSANR